MGSKGAHTSRIFGQQYASGALRGEIEARVAAVSSKSGSMEVALALRQQEERRAAFHFAIAKNMTKVQAHLRVSDGRVAERIARSELEPIIRKVLALSWSDEHIKELLDVVLEHVNRKEGPDASIDWPVVARNLRARLDRAQRSVGRRM